MRMPKGQDVREAIRKTSFAGPSILRDSQQRRDTRAACVRRQLSTRGAIVDAARNCCPSRCHHHVGREALLSMQQVQMQARLLRLGSCPLCCVRRCLFLLSYCAASLPAHEYACGGRQLLRQR